MVRSAEDELKGSSLTHCELREMGNKAFKDGAFDKAIKLYSEAIACNPNEAVLFSNRSAAYIKKKAFLEAMRDAESAIAIDKLFPKAYSRLHNALCNLGRFAEAAQKLKQGIADLESCKESKEDITHLQELYKSAEDGRRAVEIGRRFLDEGNLLAAEQALAATARAFPECASVAFMFGESYAAHRPDEVTRSLLAFAQSHESDPVYLYVRALGNYHRGQDGFKTAQALLRQALELDPDNQKTGALFKKLRAIELHKTNGNTAFSEKRHRDAVSAYAAAIEVDPTNVKMVATLRGNQAAAKMELKEYSSALLDCDFAIDKGAASAKLYARRGRIHEALNDYENALKDIQKAAEMDSSYNSELHHVKLSAKRANRKNYYKILGLPPSESDDASIKRAYKKSCLQWHPDKWAHASEEEKNHAEKMFKEVGEAFSILSDPRKKSMYDNGQLDNAVEGGGGGCAGGFCPGFSQGNEEMLNMMNAMFRTGLGGDTFGFSRGSQPRHQGFAFKFF